MNKAVFEPMGWLVRGYGQFKTGTPGAWRYFHGTCIPSVNEPDCCDFHPVPPFESGSEEPTESNDQTA